MRICNRFFVLGEFNTQKAWESYDTMTNGWSCRSGAPITVTKKNGFLKISVPFKYRQEIYTVIEVTYDKKVTDIIEDATDYNEYSKSEIFKNEAVIVADV